LEVGLWLELASEEACDKNGRKAVAFRVERLSRLVIPAPLSPDAVLGLVELELQVRWTQPRAGELRWRTLRLLPPTLEARP